MVPELDEPAAKLTVDGLRAHQLLCRDLAKTALARNSVAAVTSQTKMTRRAGRTDQILPWPPSQSARATAHLPGGVFGVVRA